ncbi:unnamed protein product [Closterium sp. NIES-53]
MASLRVLAFDHEGRQVQFDTWLEDLQLYLLSDSKDSVSLFDLASGAATAPPATADSSTRSQWLTRDAAALLAIRNHLPLAECSHFGHHRTAQAMYNAVVARYSSPATAALGRLLLPYLFHELSAFTTVEDLVSHLRASDARYRAAVPAEFLDRNPPPIDNFLSLDPTSLTVDLLEQHLLAAETSAVAVGAARGTPRPPFFEGCSPSPLAPSYASAAAADVSVPEDVGTASASAKRRSSKGKGGWGGGGGSGGGGGGSGSGGGGSSGGGGGGGTVGGSGGSGGSDGGSGGSGGSGGGGIGSGGTGARRVRSGGGQRQQQQRRSETPVSPAASIAIFDLDFDAMNSAMYALFVSAEGDCYRCVPPDLGIAATALGASESSTLPGTAPAEALHTFTLDSGASRCFFRDSTTLTPLPAPVPVRLADPSRGPVVASSSTVLPCPAVPSGSLSGLHLPSFSTNLVSTAALQDAMVTTTTPGGHRVSICTCTRTGHHMATFTRRPGSSLYTLATEPSQTLLWHHRLGHPSLPCLRGMHSSLLHAAPHSSSFPPTTAPLQTLHMDVWGPARVSGQGRERYFLLVVDDYTRYTMVFPLRSKGQVIDVLIPWICTVRLQLRERFGQDLPVLRLHSDRGGEFSSNLLWDFCRREGILQSFTLPDSPQQNGIAERHIGLVMEVARTSMIHAAAPHFLWPFAVQYVAHQLNLWPHASLLETSPALRWTADKLSFRAIPCVFLGFVPDAPGWQFYHPTLRRVFPSQDVTFDESVSFYRLFPYRSAPPLPPPLVLAPDPLPGPAPVQVAVKSSAARGTGSGGGVPGGAEPEGVEPGGARPGGVATEGGWFVRRTRLWSGASRAGGAGTARDGGTATTGPGGARTWGTGAAGTGCVEGAGAGDLTESGTTGAGGAGAGGARFGGPGAGGAGVGGLGVGGVGAGVAGAVDPGGSVRPRPYFVPLLQQVLGTPPYAALTPPLLCPPPDQLQPPLEPASPLPAPSPYTEQSGGLTEHREPASRPVSPVPTARRVPRSRPPPVPGTHTMTLRPSSVPLRVPLPAPPESSLPEVPEPESNRACAASPTVSCLLATAVSDPSYESAAASALIAELLDFAVACRLDYASALVAEPAFASPPSVGGECALGTDVLEDRQQDFECQTAAVPRFASMLLAPEGDPDAPDIPTPRSYAEAITACPSPSYQAAMDAKMASWKSTGTYVDEVPPPGANIVDGMWIFRRDYELHSLDFSTAFLQGSLHDKIWLRRPPGFTETTLAALGFAPATPDPSLFPRTNTSLPPFYVLVYVDDLVFATADTEALTLVKSELHKRHSCNDLGELRSYLGLQFTRNRARRTITLTRSHMVHQVLQRFVFQFSSPQLTPLSTCHSLSAPPSDESVEPSGAYPELVGCLITSGMGLVLGGRGPCYTFSLGSGSDSWWSTHSSAVLNSSCEAEIYTGAIAAQELHWLTYLLTDLGEQPRSPPVLYVDNKAMIALCQEHRLEHRTKHIALRYFLARELQQRDQLRLAYVATRANTADVFTKALPPDDHQRFVTVLRLVPTLPHLLTA